MYLLIDWLSAVIDNSILSSTTSLVQNNWMFLNIFFFHNCIYLWCRYLYCTLYIITICDLKVPKDTNHLFLYSHENPLEERFWCKSYIFLLFYNTFYFQTYIYFNLSKNLKAIQKQKNSFVKNCLNLFQWKGNFANTYINLLNI